MKSALRVACVLFATNISDAECALARRTVNASEFGFDSKDATVAVQAAIDSGAEEVRLSDMGMPWFVRPIALRSNLELVFGRGVRVCALPGAYRSQGEMMLTANNVTNVVIRGESDVVLSMNKSDYQDIARYCWSEWRHLLTLRDSADITVTNLTLCSSGGDGIYVARCKNVSLEDLVCRDHHRQGISVIGAERMAVRRCRISGTHGTPPACGIDFEPNAKGDVLSQILVEDCTFDGNAADGGHFHLTNLRSDSEPVDILMRNCCFMGNGQQGIGYYGSWGDSVRGRIVFEHCSFSANRCGAASISWQRADALELLFRDCVFDASGMEGPAITLDNGSAAFDCGGIAFENVRMRLGGNEAFLYVGMPGYGVTNVSGECAMERSGGKVRCLSLSEFALSHRPDRAQASSFSAAPVHLETLVCEEIVSDLQPAVPDWFGGRVRYALCVQQPRQVKVRIRSCRAGDRPLSLDVRIADRVGTPVDAFQVTETDVVRTVYAQTANTYLVEVRTGPHVVSLECEDASVGVLADNRLSFGASNGERVFRFEVPEKARKIQLELLAGIKSPSRAQLVTPEGCVRADSGLRRAGIVLTAGGSDGTIAAGIWKLVIDAPQGCIARLGGDVTAVLSTAAGPILRTQHKANGR